MNLNKLTEKAQGGGGRGPARGGESPTHAGGTRTSPVRAGRSRERRRACDPRKAWRLTHAGQPAPEYDYQWLRSGDYAGTAGLRLAALQACVRVRSARSRATEGRFRQYR